MCRSLPDPSCAQCRISCASSGVAATTDLSRSVLHHHRHGDNDSSTPSPTAEVGAEAEECPRTEEKGGGRDDGDGDDYFAAATAVVRRRHSAAEVAEEAWKQVRIAVPLILAGLLLYPRGMISMFFLGRMGGGEMELAGGSLAMAFANITGYSVLYGLALGMEPICGQAHGAGNVRLMAATTKKAMAGLLAASLPIATLWLNMEPILLFCGQDPGVTATAALFLRYSLPDLATHSLLHPLRIHLRSRNITSPLSVAAAAALPLHLLSNLLLVSFLHLGIRGVALASITTNASMLLFFVAYFRFSGFSAAFFDDHGTDDLKRSKQCMADSPLDWPHCAAGDVVLHLAAIDSTSSSGSSRSDDDEDGDAMYGNGDGDAANYKILSSDDEDEDYETSKLQLPMSDIKTETDCHHQNVSRGLWRSFWQEWGPLVRLAIPSCVSVCLEWWWYELMIMAAGLLPNARAAVAAMGILIQMTALIYIFPSSLGVAASTRVSNELGGSRPKAARLAARVACGAAVAAGVAAAAFTVGMRDVWGKVFTGDTDIRRLTAAALPVIGLCELGNGPQTAACGVLRGSARPSLGVKINLAAFYLVGAPVSLAAVFALGFGLVGLWEGLLAAQLACAAAMMVALRRTDWEEEAKRARKLTGGGGGNPSETEKGGGKCGAKDSGEEERLLVLVTASTEG